MSQISKQRSNTAHHVSFFVCREELLCRNLCLKTVENGFEPICKALAETQPLASAVNSRIVLYNWQGVLNYIHFRAAITLKWTYHNQKIPKNIRCKGNLLSPLRPKRMTRYRMLGWWKECFLNWIRSWVQACNDIVLSAVLGWWK